MKTTIEKALQDSKYLRTLQSFQDRILNSNKEIAINDLKNNSIFKSWYDKLDASGKAQIDKIANLDGNSTSVSKQELKTMLVLFDANFENNQNIVDGSINVSNNTSLGKADFNIINWLYKTFATNNSYKPLKIQLPNKYSNEALEKSYSYQWDRHTCSYIKTSGSNTTGIIKAQKFAKSLEDNKKNLMADLNITSDEYDNLANMAMGIAEQETHFGQGTYTDTKGNSHWQKRLLAKEIGYLADEVLGEKITGDFVQSVGVTQIRWKTIVGIPGALELCKKYGINSEEDLVKDTAKAAIATMIILRAKQKTAQSKYWQDLISRNNENITNPEEQITTDDMTVLFWNSSASGVKARFSQGETLTINTGNSAPDKKDGFTYPRLVRAYREGFYKGITTKY